MEIQVKLYRRYNLIKIIASLQILASLLKREKDDNIHKNFSISNRIYYYVYPF
jgi:hypothetical protein